MDGLFRLFCGCCGIQGDPEPPYSHLRDDAVTPARDPPLRQTTNHHYNQSNPLQQQGFVNPVHEFYSNFDATDGNDLYHPAHHPHGGYSDSQSPPSADLDEEIVEDEMKEREQLDNIVENTQHSIIAIGQTDVDGVIMMDTHQREKAYKAKAQKMACAQPSTTTYDAMYDFQFEPTQTPVQVPIRYDEVSATIDPSPIERMPFSCPDFNLLKLARTMGAKNPQFLVEHPDLKSAGKSPSVTSAKKQDINEALDGVHASVVAIEIEPRDLIVSMDF